MWLWHVRLRGLQKTRQPSSAAHMRGALAPQDRKRTTPQAPTTERRPRLFLASGPPTVWVGVRGEIVRSSGLRSQGKRCVESRQYRHAARIAARHVSPPSGPRATPVFTSVTESLTEQVRTSLGLARHRRRLCRVSSLTFVSAHCPRWLPAVPYLRLFPLAVQHHCRDGLVSAEMAKLVEHDARRVGLPELRLAGA